jgi:pimeloyl-ACP methyl ester carboxylesterase
MKITSSDVRKGVPGLIALWCVALAGCHGTPSAVDRLHPCGIDEGPSDAFCGRYGVFENRATQTGRKIDLKIVVAPALRRTPQPDPLFIFEGGPGAGAATLAGVRLPLFRRFQLDRDIVFIDQRGTGDSNPLTCTPNQQEAEDMSKIDEYPVDRLRTCLEKFNADVRQYTTAIAMDDIDEVRRFLGYGTINLWGGSYGTRAALVYLKRHEDSVRSAVLDAVAPPDMRLPLFAARDGQRALDAMIADCGSDKQCAATFPHLSDSVKTVMAQAEAKRRISFIHPRTGETKEIALSQRVVGFILFNALYDPTAVSLLPRLITDAAGGNYQGLLALAFARTAQKGMASEGMFLSVVCSEDMPYIQPADIAEESKGRFLGAAFFETRLRPCEFWPKGQVADDFYQPVTSSKPVLILSGQDDPITPPQWGEQVARSLPNSKQVVMPGAGHGITGRGCVPQLMSKFLTGASIADLDTACVQTQHRPAFFVSYTGGSSHD